MDIPIAACQFLLTFGKNLNCGVFILQRRDIPTAVAAGFHWNPVNCKLYNSWSRNTGGLGGGGNEILKVFLTWAVETWCTYYFRKFRSIAKTKIWLSMFQAVLWIDVTGLSFLGQTRREKKKYKILIYSFYFYPSPLNWEVM